MGKLVSPKVYLIGYTTIDNDGLRNYLKDTGNAEFWLDVEDARNGGLSDGEILCSFYGKLCYRSHTVGQNKNVSHVRDITANIENCFDHGHGSVFEHCQLNFVAHDVSRVFEAELIRHRVGTAFSIQSGRYHREDDCDIVFDPILEPVRHLIESAMMDTEIRYRQLVAATGLDKTPDFATKKKLTSALRRILPEGKAKEVGFSINLRALRHVVQLRTSRAAEWEIRTVFGQVYRLVKAKFPLVFYGAREEIVDGLIEVSGMKTQPYSE